MAPDTKRHSVRKSNSGAPGAARHSTGAGPKHGPGAANQRKARDSFAFGRHIHDEEQHNGEAAPKHGKQHGAKKEEACPEKNSDSELERERTAMLPPRCKTYRNEDQQQDDGSTQFREAPDFEQLESYDEYLDHYVSWKDLSYFESDEVARTIIKLGFRVPELLSKEQFEDVMKEIRAKRYEKRRDDIHISWEIQADIKTPLMQALADREVANRIGNLTTIVYIRTTNLKNEEVSAWIDFRVRLKSDDKLWYDYFSGKRKLIPRQSDLCYYNWTSFQVRFNSSENYLVTTDINAGLQFMNKLDRKLVTVNPKGSPGDNTDVIHIRDPQYMHAMVYDHFLRIKA